MQRVHSPRQQNNEDLERPKDTQRQRREPHVGTENDLIREIDTIIRSPHIGGDSRNAQRNYAREAKDSYDELFG